MSAEGKFEKTRIQDPEKAHEVANILSASMESGKVPTAQDYDKALSELEKLQKMAREEISSVHKVTKPLRDVWAGMIAGGGASTELLVIAMLNVTGAANRQDLTERFERIGDDYEKFKTLFSSAGEKLEELKSKGKEFGKK